MTLLQRYGFDGLVLDLDGAVHRGPRPIPGVAEAISRAQAAGIGVACATNNASKSAETIAHHLQDMGMPLTAEVILTSVDALVTHLRAELNEGSSVYVVGAASLRDRLRAEGWHPADPFTPADAVVQGFSPNITWNDLAAACWAIQHGAQWIATNLDATIPLDWGQGPGNGSMTLPIAEATGQRPLACGKPHGAIYRAAISRIGAHTPLFVGDRLDTDVQGAKKEGIHAMVVLTGVATPLDIVCAPPHQRPDFIGASLVDIHEDLPAVADASQAPASLTPHPARDAALAAAHQLWPAYPTQPVPKEVALEAGLTEEST